MMDVYDMLFADQDLESLLTEVELPSGSALAAARARLWEGRFEEAATMAAGAGEPWSSFLTAAARIRAGLGAKRTLLAIAEDPSEESRVRAWAWTALRSAGDKPSAFAASEALGVIIEVPMNGAADVLAAYADGRVRFLGHADQVIVRETDGTPDATVDALIAEGHALLKVPPAPRTGAPVTDGMVRLNALSALGVHTVEVPWSELDPPGTYAALFTAAAKLLQEITSA